MRLLRFQPLGATSWDERKLKKKHDSLFSYKSYLYEKKKCLKIYGNLKYQAVSDYCQEARDSSGKVENNLLFLLEKRLDVALYKVRFCETIAKARQMIKHGKILVNNQVIQIPSYELRLGDIIKAKIGRNFCRTRTVKKIRPKKTNRNFLFLQRKGFLFQSFKRRLRRRHRLKKKKHKTFKNLNFEINNSIGVAISLFPPQKLFLPTKINPNFVDRSLR
jgi:ribosomal protein S4